MHLSPQQNIFYGFGLYTLLGTLALCTPLCDTVGVPFIDHLFVATSAISTTGLATISVSDTYSWLGELIVMLLVQAGGIGYMTFTSFILLAGKSKFTHWHEKVLNVEFSLPTDLGMRDFVKSVIVFTAVCETIGALLIFYYMRQDGMALWPAVWSAVFHSVSSFCTAGFGLLNNSFENYAGHVGLNMTISVLSILGGLGFIVVTDLWNRLRGVSDKMTFTTWVILTVYLIVQVAGTLVIFFGEPSLAHMHTGQRLMASFFQAMSAITTVGFNTVPIGALSLPVLLCITFLMYVGASPSGTGGGLKSTTIAALAALMWSRIKGHGRVMLLGRKIPMERLYVATSTYIFYTALVFLGTFLLSFSEPFAMERILFEVVSAIGTVGLSTGITGSLTVFGKLVITALMFIGRLGVITFGLAILARRGRLTKTFGAKNEDLAV
jgi:trk system potassium uptake protein TrkH